MVDTTDERLRQIRDIYNRMYTEEGNRNHAVSIILPTNVDTKPAQAYDLKSVDSDLEHIFTDSSATSEKSSLTGAAHFATTPVAPRQKIPTKTTNLMPTQLNTNLNFTVGSALLNYLKTKPATSEKAPVRQREPYCFWC